MSNTSASSAPPARLLGEGRTLTTLVLVSGVGLQAIETFIGSTLLPSVVNDIGGIDLFAWNATLFIVASIMAAIFAAVRPFGLGPRGVYGIATIAFALGSLLCGLAPNMGVMLAGRAIQGFGAGLLNAMSYMMVRLLFPQVLWPRAFALISAVWGISTLFGPAIGGVFAAFGAWRLAFILIAPLAVLLGALTLRVLKGVVGEPGMARAPLPQILLLIGAVLAVSVASILTETVMLPAVLVGLAVLAIIALGVIDQHRETRLMPSGTFALGSRAAALYAAMFLINMAITCDLFVPLLLQHLHGLPPLAAGYMVALVALGWSSGSMTTASWSAPRSRITLRAAPILLFVGTAGLFAFIPQGQLGWPALIGAGVALYLLGLGVGIAWPHLTTRILGAAPKGESDLTSAAISMVQLFSTGLGAALGGVVVNAGGLPLGQFGSAAQWLFGLFALVPLVVLPILWATVRDEAAGSGPIAPDLNPESGSAA